MRRLDDEGQPVLALRSAQSRYVHQRELPVLDGSAVILLARPFLHVFALELQPAGLGTTSVVLVDFGQDGGVDSLRLGALFLGAQGFQLCNVGEETVRRPLLMQTGSTQTGTHGLSLVPFGLGLLQDGLYDLVGRLGLAFGFEFLFGFPERRIGRRRSPRGPSSRPPWQGGGGYL